MDKKEIKQLIKNEITPLLIGIRNDLDEYRSKFFYEDSEIAGVLIKGEKGENGVTPVSDKDYPSEETVFNFIKENLPKRGKDYFTNSDIKDIVQQVSKLIPKPQDGKDGVVDYEVVKNLAKPIIEGKYKELKGYVKDMSDAILEKIENSKKPELTASQIRNKLESLTGKDRLDAKAIKGLEKFMSTFIATSGGGGGSGGSQTTSPAGSNTEIQFNDNNAFGSSDLFKFNKTDKRLEMDGSDMRFNLLKLGDELVVNGTFDTDLSGWTYGAGVTWVSGKANITGNTDFSQTVPVTVGVTYQVEFTISSYSRPTTPGTLNFTFAGVTLASFPVDFGVPANGTYILYVTALNTNAFVVDVPSSGLVGFQLDDVSVKEVINISKGLEIITSDNPFLMGDFSGNTRGTGSIDMQFSRTAITPVASGTDSLAFGYKNTVSGQEAFAVGHTNTASGYRSTVFGYNNSNTGTQCLTVGIGNTQAGSNGTVVGVSNVISGGTGVGSSNRTNGGTVIGSSSISVTGTSVGNSVVNRIASSATFGVSSSNVHTRSGFIGLNTVSNVKSLSLNGTTSVFDTASLGTELVTNGDFTTNTTGWTLPTGWTYASQRVFHSADGTGALTPTTPLSITAGKIYNVSFGLIFSGGIFDGSGTLTVSLGGVTSPIIQCELLQSETITLQFKATTTGNLTFTPSNTARFSIDAVSVKEVLGGDIYANKNIGVGTMEETDFGGGSGVFALPNCKTVPTTNPASGFILYSEAGVLKVRDSSGTVKTVDLT
jgi:hypothetical protein